MGFLDISPEALVGSTSSSEFHFPLAFDEKAAALAMRMASKGSLETSRSKEAKAEKEEPKLISYSVAIFEGSLSTAGTTAAIAPTGHLIQNSVPPSYQP